MAEISITTITVLRYQFYSQLFASEIHPLSRHTSVDNLCCIHIVIYDAELQ